MFGASWHYPPLRGGAPYFSLIKNEGIKKQSDLGDAWEITTFNT